MIENLARYFRLKSIFLSDFLRQGFIASSVWCWEKQGAILMNVPLDVTYLFPLKDFRVFYPSPLLLPLPIPKATFMCLGMSFFSFF